MTARVVVDGMPREPIPFDEYRAAVEPVAALLGVELDDVVAIAVSPKAVRAKVIVRNKRGRRLVDSWAHLVRAVDFPDGPSHE